MVQIESFVFNPFSENTYILHDETKEAIIIDPGCYDRDELKEVTDFIDQQGLRPFAIINTHAHIDHVLGVSALKRIYNIPFALHRMEEPVLKAVKSYASNYGFPVFEEPSIDEYLTEGIAFAFGNTELDVLFVPGHAPGHVAFVSHAQRFVIGGDVLFRQSIGRTDLPGGNHATLLRSIQTQLFTLPDDYEVYAGHMSPTTIGFEKNNNPFFN